ncbi:alpha/beta fold hydrolase [uncultured Paraglaciecola sp.]|uniref:alpha/beta hydrolase family protein n=1 Tax=uncultured Paraglaciecola sp. TaxID=1765024 RepID=UPI002595E53C|nr:alpha/beta fold hydrolase [uncultured Paraglaciecola sp.]
MKKRHSSLFLLIATLFFYSGSSFSTSLSIEDFVTPPTILNASISPNGKYVASTLNKGDARLIVVYDIDQQKVVGSFGDHIIRPYHVSWANNQRLLVNYLVPHGADRLRKKAKTEQNFDLNQYYMYSRLVSTNIDGTESVGLFNDQRAAKDNKNLVSITDYLLNDDAHVLMSANIKTRLTLFKLNINTGKSTKIVKGGRFTIGFINDSEANITYRYDYKRVAKTIEIFRFNAKEDDWALVDTIYFDEDDQSKNNIEFKDLVGVRDQHLIYRRLNKETGYHELMSVNETETKVLVSVPDTDIVGVITEGFSNNVIGYNTVKDVYRSHYFDADSQKAYDKISTNYTSENFLFTSLAKNGTRALLVSWGANNPLTYSLHDLKTNKTSHFSYPYKTLPKAKLASGQAIHYNTRDGQRITAYLYLPADFDGSKPYPAVVMPHGGPQYRDKLDYDAFTQFIATRGYVVIKPNFRGSSGYGMAFQEAGYKQWGKLMQDDVEDAVHYLVDKNIINKQQVCIAGASYGGYVALMATAKTPDLYKCAISINGLSNLPDLVEYELDRRNTNVRKDFVKTSIGDPKLDKDLLKNNSPELLIDKIKVPILLIYGDEDKVVPYSQSKQMYKALTKMKKPVQIIRLEDTGHNPFNDKETRRKVFEEMEIFLSEYLE